MASSKVIFLKILLQKNIFLFFLVLNVTLFLTYSLSYNEVLFSRPFPRLLPNIFSFNAPAAQSSFDKFLHEVELKFGSENTKYIYQVNNEAKTVGKRGITYNEEFFLNSKKFFK